jgi:NADH dehydrogenase
MTSAIVREREKARLRVQAANQRTAHLARQIERRLRDSLQPYTYRDFGSLVSLGKWSTVGSRMGFLFGRCIFVEGLFARVMYRSQRILHERALGGTAHTLLSLLTRALVNRAGPHVNCIDGARRVEWSSWCCG